MSAVLADGRPFGDLRLSRLTWREIEALYAAMQADWGGSGVDPSLRHRVEQSLGAGQEARASVLRRKFGA